MTTGLSAASFEHLQLGAGMFLKDLNISAATSASALRTLLASAIASGVNVLGATRGGGTFQCTPKWRQLEADGLRSPVVGGTVNDGWTVKLSGTLLEITPANAAMLLNAPLYADEGSRAVLVPDPTPVPPASDDVCWVGSTGSGMLAIHLFSPISTGGMVFRASRNGLGEAAFTLMAHKRSPADTGLPCRLLWMKEGSA